MAHPEQWTLVDEMTSRAAAPLARRLRDAKASITYRWLERIAQHVTVDAGEIFPSKDLLNHVPLLIDAVADYLEDPGGEGASADEVIGKATELGEMRYNQGFAPFQILKEFEVLGGIISQFLIRTSRDLAIDCPPAELLVCSHRVQQAVAKIQQTTAARHLALAEQRTNDREQRLRTFNGVLRTDVRRQLEAALAAAREVGDEEQVERLSILAAQIEQLVTLSFVQSSARQQRNVGLPNAVAEAVRQVRDLAADRDVHLDVLEPLPDIEVNRAVVELCLVAYLTNAIRYADPTHRDPRVEISARYDEAASELAICVRDNGRSVSPNMYELIFQSFVAPETVGDEGSPGMGLSFVRETIESLGGRAWAESSNDPPGSLFAFTLPTRRADDREAIATPA